MAIVAIAGGGQPASAASGEMLVEEFESAPSDWTAGWYDAAGGARNNFSTITDGVSGNGLRVTMPAGAHFGSAAQYRFEDNAQVTVDELYYRYFLRFPTSWTNHGRGKLPGPAGLYGSSGRNGIKPTDANPGWSARMAFSPTYTSRDDDHTQLGFYVYHRNQPTATGEYFMWDPQPGTLAHGEWYCVEGRVRMNTPGVADGILEGWVDEKLALAHHDFVFRGSGDAGVDVRSFWFDVYYGGDAPAPGTLSVDFDGLVLSGDRVGCGDLQGTFKDTAGNTHADNIDRLAHAGITKGCNPPANDRFCPGGTVTRGQMAAFLSRALTLPAATGDRFTDDDGSTFEADIERLAAAGITRGCSDAEFCPDGAVTRGQMAAFLSRALALPADTGDRFTDDDGSTFEADIERLAAAGITAGCNPPANDRFCPGEAVTRAQMATFLSRALDLPAPPPAAGPVAPEVPSGFDAVVPAGWSIQAVANSQPAGARIALDPGLFAWQTVTPKDGQSFEGEPGTVLDGMGEGGYAFSGASDDVTVRGVEILNYAGGIGVDGDGWTIDDVDAHDNELAVYATGDRLLVRESTFTNHQLAAITVDGASAPEIRDNVVTLSGQAKTTTYTAGIRLRSTAGAAVTGNAVTDNHGYGIWYQDGATDTLVYGNTAEGNLRAGIVHDHAYRATVSNNVLTGNGWGVTGDENLLYGAGFLVRGPDVEAFGNLVTTNRAAITVVDHSASVDPGPLGPYVPDRVWVHDNELIDSGPVGIASPNNPSVLATSTYEGNIYRSYEPGGLHWRWDRYYDFAGWQAIGNDITGSAESDRTDSTADHRP